VATVRLNGIDFCFERRGEGPRLLFVNGSGATLASMAPLLDAFAARFELLAHDQRGLGRTEIPPGPYSMSDYGNDASALAASVGWDTYRVVGISFGGMVAQELAVTFPERIERLALLCTSAGGAGGSSYPLHMLGALNPEARAAAGSSMVDTRFTPEWLEAAEDDRRRTRRIVAARRPGRVRRLPSTAANRVPDTGGGRPLRRHRARCEQ
jgi:3-oxoadipate enol-lactonase